MRAKGKQSSSVGSASPEGWLPAVLLEAVPLGSVGSGGRQDGWLFFHRLQPELPPQVLSWAPLQ